MHSPSNNVSEESLHEGYEVSDMNTGVISGCFVALAVITIASLFAIIIIMRGFDQSRPPMNAAEASPVQTDTVFAEGAPPLQMDPVADRKALTAEAEGHLHSYGHVSQEPGMERVHIPIERAIELVGSGAVPYRQAPTIALEENAAAAEAAPQGDAPAAQ
jgi:hypothetical protein